MEDVEVKAGISSPKLIPHVDDAGKHRSRIGYGVAFQSGENTAMIGVIAALILNR